MKTFRNFVAFSVAALFILTFLPLTGQEFINHEARRQERLREFSEKMSRQWHENRAEAEERAKKQGIPVREVLPDGTVIELQRYWNNIPLYYTTQNLEAAETIAADKVWEEGGAGLSLSGSTETLGIWDEGKVRTSHQEFGERVTWKDDAALSDHATHVAGTMIAAGVEDNARGMSYEALLHAYDWENDLGEMADEAGDGMRISNHSYAFSTGWIQGYAGHDWAWFGNTDISETEDFAFGYYHEPTAEWDELVYNSVYYLPVVAAGNERGRGPDEQPVEHYVAHEDDTATTERDIDGGPDGYNSISYFNLAKNVLSVGSVEGIAGGYTSPGDVVLAHYSAWGPTDDGRIKPDVVAKGVSTYSTSSDGDEEYTYKGGTSMAAPSVAGSIGLLQEHYREEVSETAPLASTMRGLVLHTVDQTGANEGPDYEHGWGLMNTESAADVISEHADVQDGHIFEITLASGEEYSMVVEGNDQPLKVTVAWTDPPATPLHQRTPQPPLLNNDEPMLINDLDLRVYGPDDHEYKPWILDWENPSDPADTGDNDRDNVEQVYIEQAESGEPYTIEVTHKEDSLEGGSQDFSLIVTGQLTEPGIRDWMDY